MNDVPDMTKFTDGWLFDELSEQQESSAEQTEIDSAMLDAVASESICEHDISIVSDRLNEAQMSFVDADEWWKAEWKDMPEFIQADFMPVKTVYVHFRTIDDMNDFAALVGQKIAQSTKSIWFPIKERRKSCELGYVDES